MKKSLRSIVLLATLAATVLPSISPASAGVNGTTKITKIIMWNEWNQVIVQISGGQPSTGYLWFDGSTVPGKNLLSLLTAAQLSGKNIYVSWVDTPDPGILGTSANKIAAVSMQ